jgi:hypothetical protein
MNAPYCTDPQVEALGARVLKYLILTCVFAVLYITLFFCHQALAGGITIHNGRALDVIEYLTDIHAGPDSGQILQRHFFPGMIAYINGKYKNATDDLLFFLRHPEQTKMNVRHAEFHSTAHYLLGMVYFYHASGRGRLVRAKKHFEDSIRWNLRNYKSYIELSHLFYSVDLKSHSSFVLKKLLDLSPPEDIVQQANRELYKIQDQKHGLN